MPISKDRHFANYSTVPFTRTDSVGVRALLPDTLGSTIVFADNTGALQTQYTYEPFGVTTQTGATSMNSYKFTGREDDGAGLYYYRARYYQPSLQRSISEDPIEFLAGDMNLYGYVGNNPLDYNDHFGLDKTKNCPGYGSRYLNHVLTYTIDVGAYATALGGGYLWRQRLVGEDLSWAPRILLPVSQEHSYSRT